MVSDQVHRLGHRNGSAVADDLEDSWDPAVHRSDLPANSF